MAAVSIASAKLVRIWTRGFTAYATETSYWWSAADDVTTGSSIATSIGSTLVPVTASATYVVDPVGAEALLDRKTPRLASRPASRRDRTPVGAAAGDSGGSL